MANLMKGIEIPEKMEELPRHLASDEQIKDFLWAAKDAKVIAVDTETTGFHVSDGRDYAMGLSIAFKQDGEYRTMYFPFRHPSENIDWKWFPHVKWVVEHAPITVFHHAKFDLPSLETLGIKHTGAFYCTMLMAHLINELKPYAKSLEALCKYYVGPDVHKDMHPMLKFWINAFGWGSVPGDVMYTYGATDAVITLKLVEVLYPRFLKEVDDAKEMWAHKQKMVRLLVKMKQRGVRADLEKCRANYDLATQQMDEIIAKLGFDPTPANIGKYLIDKLGLPVLKRTKKGKPSFTSQVLDEYEEMLERLLGKNESVELILAYRGWQKSRAAFFGAWIENASPDGRIRPDYIMHKDPDDGGTTTGRLSCKNPNLQQIPRISTKPWHKDVKPSLIPDDGYVLVEADYSQLELRLSAAYSQERSLIRVFQEGRDIFDEMSVRMGLTRDKTKTFVYSTQYGAGVNRLMNVFGVSKRGAQEMQEGYRTAYPGLYNFSKEAASKVRQAGKIRIWSGRYRHFQNPEEENHKAMNACIQGGAADVVERIMVKCFEEFDHDEECRILMQIHDAIVFEIRKDKLTHYLHEIKRVMESVNEIADFGVPFAVDGHIWGTKERLI